MERADEAPEARDGLAVVPLPDTSAVAAGQHLHVGEVVQLLQHVVPAPGLQGTQDSAECSLTEVSGESMDEREAALIRRVLLGDADAYAEVVTPHLGIAKRLASSQLRGTGDVDDCVQKAAIRAWERLRNLKADKPFRPWFLGIVVRQCQEVRRSNWVMRRVHSAFWDPADEDEWLERCVEGARLRKAFARLPRDQQVAIYLHCVEDLPQQEVAAAMEIRTSNVKAKIYRAKQQLRKELQEDEER
jgi:RNA polymerase sigma-70 factor (ECF subfamily)